MFMNKPCWLLLQLAPNTNFSFLSLSSSFSLGTAGSSDSLSGPCWGFLPGPGPPEITDIFTGHDCASKMLRESNPGVPWHVGKCPLPHYMPYLVTWPQERLAYAPMSLETLGEKRWTFSFCQRSGSIKGSYGRVGTDITLTFLSFLYQRPMSFCLGSVR